MNKKTKKYLLDFMQIIIGSGIMSVGIALFLVPNQLSSGGFSGIAIILYYLFKLPMGTMILVLNIPLFILAFFKLGREFFFKALIGTGVLSIIIDFFERFPPLTDDKFLACIYGGIIIGIGTAIILRAKASTGGTELATNIIKVYRPHMRLSQLLIILDIVIVAGNVLFFKEPEIGLYSAITIYISGKMLDIFFEGINFTKVVLIVSNKHEEIAKKISIDVERGVTRTSWARNVHRRREDSTILCNF